VWKGVVPIQEVMRMHAIPRFAIGVLVLGLSAVVVSGCSSADSSYQAPGPPQIEVHQPTAADFTDGWRTDYSGEPEGTVGGGVSDVSASTDVTSAAVELWPVAALGYAMPPEKERQPDLPRATGASGDYELAAIFPVVLPTPASLEARQESDFRTSLAASDVFVVLMHNADDGDLRVFGMARRNGVWQYSIDEPTGLDEIPFIHRQLSAEQSESLVLICRQEETCWGVYAEEPGTLSARLLYVPHYTEMHIDDQRVPVGVPMDWSAVLQPFELRY
jgi:hypothetical protein